MKPYGNRRQNAGVIAYEYGPDWILLKFAADHTYKYTAAGIGAANLKTMKTLADSGNGLTTFINTHPQVRDGYSW